MVALRPRVPVVRLPGLRPFVPVLGASVAPVPSPPMPGYLFIVVEDESHWRSSRAGGPMPLPWMADVPPADLAFVPVDRPLFICRARACPPAFAARWRFVLPLVAILWHLLKAGWLRGWTRATAGESRPETG